jgi:hypothetical protein
MSSATILGNDLQTVQHAQTVSLTAFPVNTTSILYAFTVPVGFGPCRIVKASWAASAVLADADGTMLVNVIVRDASEGADDTIVASASVEGGVAHAVADFALATEDTEKQQTLDEGDSVRVTFVNNSAAIDTNGAIGVTIHFHSIPKEAAGDDVKHASNYR